MKLTTLQKLLTKYHRGSATDAERYVVDRWYESLSEGEQEAPGLRTEAEKARTKSRIWQGIPKPDKPIRWYQNKLLKIAASITLLVGVSIWLHFSNDSATPKSDSLIKNNALSQVITTGSRQLKHIKLPDSTEVWLNANSRLEVPQSYGADERHITLSGEAFFDVKRDTVRPFTVATSAITIRVLGTSFNVQSYERLEDIRVAVNTGVVSVTDSASQHLAELTAGQALAYHLTDGSFRLDEGRHVNAHLWRSGKVMLDRANFRELAQNFHNLYGIRLRTDDDAVASHRYNITLQANQRVEDAMELICIMVNKTYRKEADGSISIY